MLTESPTRSRTLVVEDDAVMRELLLALLDLRGHEVHVVESGEEALQWLAGAPAPHLILTDMQMPGIQGGKLVQALRSAIGPTTRLVGMSGRQPETQVIDSLDAFVLKPFGYADLEAILARLHGPEEVQTMETTMMPATAAGPVPQARRGQEEVAQSAGAVEGAAGAGNGAAAQPVLDETIFDSLRQSFRSTQLAELYTLTLNDVGTRLGRMQAYAQAGDLEAARREAHSMKGLCGMVGARELGALAAAVEAGITLDSSDVQEISLASARLRRMLDSKFATKQLPQESTNDHSPA